MNFWMAGLLVLLSIFPSLVCAQSVEPEDEAPLNESAEQEAARMAFKDGRVAYDRGRYAEALERFEHAYSLSGRSELLYNIGLAADRLREDDLALDAFEQYLRETPDSPERDQVRMRVKALRQAKARKASEAHDDPVPTPAEVAAASVREPEQRELSASTSERDDDGGVLSTWWFWTGASVLLIAGGATAYLLLQPDEADPLPQPNTDVVVMTLRHAP